MVPNFCPQYVNMQQKYVTPVAERGGLSRLRFEHPTFRKGGERSNRLRHRRGLNRTRQRVDTSRKSGTRFFFYIRV